MKFLQAINILRRSRGKDILVQRREASDNGTEPLDLVRNYEDEINDVSRCLSDSGVQLKFPRALEILLDFAFFDIDEGKIFLIATTCFRSNSVFWNFYPLYDRFEAFNRQHNISSTCWAG